MLPSGIVVLQKIVPSFKVLERSAFNKFAFVKFTFFKLFPVAPPISKNLPFYANILFFGIGINLLFERYFPVILFSFLIISLY